MVTAVRLLSFPFVLLAATFGLFGITWGLLLMTIHLVQLRSFGVPYMAPSMPPTMSDMKDMMIRAPWWFMRERPKLVPVLDRQRLRGNRGPHPPSETGGTRV
jgi:spore germination protein KA